VASRYNDWIANRIRQFDFSENQDFVALTKNLVSGGTETEHFLTLDMAKELSMGSHFHSARVSELRTPPGVKLSDDPGGVQDHGARD
jgi:phage anti-repressor protein